MPHICAIQDCNNLCNNNNNKICIRTYKKIVSIKQINAYTN